MGARRMKTGRGWFWGRGKGRGRDGKEGGRWW